MAHVLDYSLRLSLVRQGARCSSSSHGAVGEQVGRVTAVLHSVQPRSAIAFARDPGSRDERRTPVPLWVDYALAAIEETLASREAAPVLDLPPMVFDQGRFSVQVEQISYSLAGALEAVDDEGQPFTPRVLDLTDPRRPKLRGPGRDQAIRRHLCRTHTAVDLPEEFTGALADWVLPAPVAP